jgi:RND family efflux transporter MFP subunit
MRLRNAFRVGLAFTLCATPLVPLLFGPVCVNAAAEDARAADDNPPSSAQARAIKLNNCLIKAVQKARLASDRPGVLKEIAPKEGDIVKKDQIVVQLIDDVPRASLRVANLTAEIRVEVDYAAKLHAADVKEYEQALAESRKYVNPVIADRLERLKLTAERSQLQIEKAKQEAEVNRAKAQLAQAELDTYRIVTPLNGVVTRVQKFPGETVRPGDAILEVANTDVVQVEGFVKANEIWDVKPGDAVAVQLSGDYAGPENTRKVVQGRIGFVDTLSDAANGTTRVWAQVKNPDNVLRPGFKATMIIYSRSSNRKSSLDRPRKRSQLAVGTK